MAPEPILGDAKGDPLGLPLGDPRGVPEMGERKPPFSYGPAPMGGVGIGLGLGEDRPPARRECTVGVPGRDPIRIVFGLPEPLARGLPTPLGRRGTPSAGLGIVVARRIRNGEPFRGTDFSITTVSSIELGRFTPLRFDNFSCRYLASVNKL